MNKERHNFVVDIVNSDIERIARAIERLSGPSFGDRVESLNDTELVTENVIEVMGNPVYVSDVTDYDAYGITETGWYVFVNLSAYDNSLVTEETIVTGADGYIATVGENYVSIAVRFDTAPMSKKVTVNWGSYEESFVFKATDLAVRNLDYRVTFYVYDAAQYVTWEYGATEDTTFVGTKYYTLNSGEYAQAAVKADEIVPAETYYIYSYVLTSDTQFVDGKVYYTKSDDNYTEATVTAGEEVTASTYYEGVYTLTADNAFVGNKYYIYSNGEYEQAAVLAGDTIPADTYYKHTKCIISGMARNITYRLDDIIDCPMEFILPEIEDGTHGCWFEIRCRHAGEYSMTLTPPSSDVKIATEHTQKETAGINMINLHYTEVNGVKLWRFLNTHSSIPTT